MAAAVQSSPLSAWAAAAWAAAVPAAIASCCRLESLGLLLTYAL